MRFMGLDVGDRRIGVAISDETGTIASPRETLTRSGNVKDLDHLLSLAEREGVREIVVGMPYSLDGSLGPQARKVERFIEAMRAQTDIPVTTWDERFSTISAEEVLIESNIRRSKRRQTVDRVAAAIILRRFLDARQQNASAAADEVTSS